MGPWSLERFPPEERGCATSKGHYVLFNGDEMSTFVQIKKLPEHNPVPKGGVNVPVSSFEGLIKVMLYLVRRTFTQQSCMQSGGPGINHQSQVSGWLHVRVACF